MTTDSPVDASVDHLRDELSLNEALYESLVDQTDKQQERRQIAERIASLKQQINKMHPLPHWGSSSYDTPQADTQYDTTDMNSYPDYSHSAVDQVYMPPLSQSMSLPNRKRPRNDFDDEFDALAVPDNKLLRTPTTASPARSIDSFDTDFSDDPILMKILGKDWVEEKRNNEQYMRELQEKKRQEEEDAEMARALQEKWNQEHTQPPSVPRQSIPPSNYGQTFLRPDGATFHRPSPAAVEDNIKLENRLGAPTIWNSETSTPSSDDSGLEEISSDDWTSRFGSSQRRTLPPTMSYGSSTFNPNFVRMPGAFPGFGVANHYSSTPGAPVYGSPLYNTNQYNSSTSSLGNMQRQSSLFGNGSSTNGGLPGSMRMPFDLDNYPPPPSLSFADPEQTQEEIKDLLKHIRPDEELTPEQLAEIQPQGLKVTLMAHQRKGFAWMKSMEEGTNKGGILADDMGLGKTVQALALILGRPPPTDDNGHRLQRPTLIVAPVALMQQWERETLKMIHRSHQLNVLILHGGNRNLSWSEIRTYDIVLTTYGLLASDLKRKARWDKRLELVPDAKPTPQEQCPVLGERSKFHRVILDEAQNIKNKSTKAATAACRIQADYRWCLSGTPMQNSVDEIYSLIKFCRIRPYSDYEKFSKDIGRPLKSKTAQYGRDKAMQQLQALLRAVLLRRTKKSEIDGQPIIQLPEKHTVEDRAIFSEDEKAFYKALETQAQIQFNRFLKNGTVGRHYSHALVLLLRLRQCCCSPQLVTNAKDFLVAGALQDLDYVENARHLSRDVVKRLGEVEAFECPICMDAVENAIIFNPCGHSLCQECLSTMVDKAMADTESHKVNCPHCRAEIDTHKVTDFESFLRVHFPNREGVVPLEEKDGEVKGDEHSDDSDSDSDSSDDDEEDIDDDGEDLRDFVVPDEEVEFDTDASESTKKTFKAEGAAGDKDVKGMKKPAPKSKLKLKKAKSKDKKDKKGKGKGKGKSKKKSGSGIKTLAELRKEGLRSRAAKKKYLRRLGRGFQPSAKIEKTLSILREIKENGEGEKTIIFSSFTSFLDLLEVAMNREEDDLGTYTRYDGSMSGKDRNEAVMRFSDDPGCKSMLISLKAGNAGLNLTAANHVIILDPFWNPFVEHQAADRCYRIGQLKEVTIHRVLIGEADEDGYLMGIPEGEDGEFTVEDRILKLQERKRELVETALDETASGNIGRLGVRELGYLFGVNAMNG